MHDTDVDETAPLIHADHPTAQGIQHSGDHSQHGAAVLQGHALYLVLAIPYLNILLVAMDVTLVSTLSASIASDFSSLAVISWLGTVYLVAMAAAQPVSGQLTDQFGRRNGLLFSQCAFLVGNLVCGLAPNTATLIVGRVVAGVGGGTAGAVAAYITNELVPMQKRGLWQGLGGTMWSVGVGLGGVVGGVISDRIGWRWAFLSLTPVTLVLGVAAYLTVPVYNTGWTESRRGVDLPGIVTLTGTLACFIIGLNLMGDAHVSLISLLFLIVSAMMLVCLVIIELRSDYPVVPIRLLANRSVLGSCVTSFFVAAVTDTLLFNIPLFIQVQGYNTSEVGLQLLGEPIGGALGSILAGLAMESLKGYGLAKVLSFVVALASPLAFYLSNLDTDVWIAVAGVLAMGVGFGGVCSVIMVSIVAATDSRAQASVTGMMLAFRQSGSSTGLAVTGLLFRWLTIKLYDGDDADATVKECSQHGHVRAGRPEICYAYGEALHFVFLFAIALSVLAFVFGMMIRNVPLDQGHSTTSDQKRPAVVVQAEDTEEASGQDIE